MTSPLAQHDPIVSWVHPILEGYYKKTLIDVHDIQGERVDLIADGTNSEIRRHEIEVKECTIRESRENSKVFLEQNIIERSLSKFTLFSLDLYPENSKFTRLKKLEHAKIAVCLNKLESADVKEVHFIGEYRILCDKETYDLVLDSWDVVLEGIELPPGTRYVSQSGSTLNNEITLLRNIFGPSLSGFGILDPADNHQGGWSYSIGTANVNTCDCDEYIGLTLKITESQVNNFDKISNKYSENSFRSLCLVVDYGVPGLFGMLNMGVAPYLPKNEPAIAECIEELIVVNKRLNVLIVWKRNLGWSNHFYSQDAD